MDNNNVLDNRPKNKKSLWTRIKNIKHKEIILAIIVIFVAVLVYTFYVADKDKVVTTEVSTSEGLASQLEQVLGEIKGVGDVRVMITYSGGDRLDIAYKKDVHTTVINENGVITEITEDMSTPVMVDGDQPLVVGTVRAEIDGVVVVCEGGADQKVRVQVMQALATLLKIDYSRINVLEMA